jgi:hypothetical protein
VAIHNAGSFQIAEELSDGNAVFLLIVPSSLAVKEAGRKRVCQAKRKTPPEQTDGAL